MLLTFCVSAHERHISLITISEQSDGIVLQVRLSDHDFPESIHDSLIVSYIIDNISLTCDSIQPVFHFQKQFTDQQFRKFVFDATCGEFLTLSVYSTLLFDRYENNQIIVTVSARDKTKGALLNIAEPSCVFEFSR